MGLKSQRNLEDKALVWVTTCMDVRKVTRGPIKRKKQGWREAGIDAMRTRRGTFVEGSGGAYVESQGQGKRCFTMGQVAIGVTHHQYVKEDKDCKVLPGFVNKKVRILSENSLREVRGTDCSEVRKSEQAFKNWLCQKREEGLPW